MALIKVDPGQTKSAAVLILVLVAVSGVTVVRLKSGTKARPAASQAAAEARVSNAPAAGEEMDRALWRNPFQKPVAIKGVPVGPASEADTLPSVSLPARAEVTAPWNPGGDFQFGPVSPVQGPRVRQLAAPTALTDGGAVEKPRPTITLLATVGDSKGFSAVIKIGDSEARAVEKGDKLDNGFQVLGIGENSAVLTDGRDIVVARRPES